MKTAQLAILYFICLQGILPDTASAQPYVISADGTEVTDQKTGLIWRRCAEGMNWDGATCAGVASHITHEAALQLAITQAGSTGVAWRLPNVKELSSIADRSLSSPAIDTTAFPSTPISWFWSASPHVGDSSYAWVINFSNGDAIVFSLRYYDYFVRLVRTGP